MHERVKSRSLSDKNASSKKKKIFSNIVPDIGPKISGALIHHSLENKDPIMNAISKYRNYPIVKNCIINYDFVKIIFLSNLKH